MVQQKAVHSVARQVADAVVGGAEALMREAGMMPPPTVHLFMDDMEQPYAGYVSSRPFRRGADAAQAIERLGELPAAMFASRLLLAWEHADLMTALDAPGESFPAALVTVEATFAGHTLTWRSFDIVWGPVGSIGAPTVQPRWHAPVVYRDGGLPASIQALLWRWRGLDADEIGATAEALQRDGYQVRLASRNS